MQEKLNRLKEIVATSADLIHTAALLEWDQQVNMPHGAAEARGNQIATIQRLAHQNFTAPETGELLEALQPYADTLDPDSDEARIIRNTARQYEKQTKVPTRMIVEMAQVTSQAHTAWMEARAENNFPKFKPHLEKIVDLRREYAALFAPYDHPYDALLDDFEPGMKTQDVRNVFDALRPQQVALISAISKRPQVDDSFLNQDFDPDAQWKFGEKVITAFGYDWNHGRQDKSAHPFTTNFGRDDVRITTRVDPKFFNTAFFATLHECGHALYEMGSAPEYERTILAGGASLGLHESQSRLWENLVGRSMPFWKFYYPQLQQAMPTQFGNVSLDAFYKGINKVEPSLIRVEADEATYNLHIMLRFEIEVGLIEGSLQVKDLPEIWNTRMQEYLGLTPPNDAQGVLQDIHWSGGMIGYFSTYALGNIISLQLWERILQDIPDLEAKIEQGQFLELREWLRENLHCYGSKFKPMEILHRITGNGLDAAPYMRYLNNKFGAIYGL